MNESGSQSDLSSSQQSASLSRRLISFVAKSWPVRSFRRFLVQLTDFGLRDTVECLETRITDIETQIDVVNNRLSSVKETVWKLNIVPIGKQAVVSSNMLNYEQQVAENYADLSDKFDSYRRLVDGLIAIDQNMVVPACELAEEMESELNLVTLRHDIDADPVTAVRMARYLASKGVAGTFYLLHTAIYYGEFHNHLFVRNPQLVDWVRAFIVAGCELGLHNDAFGASQIPGINGAMCLKEEINWLRSHGVNLKGTAGHNSLPSYGAENSEVFLGRRLWSRQPVTITGVPLPMEALNEQELGLTYEGTFAVPQEDIDVELAEAFAHNQAGASIRNEQWMKQYLTENPYCQWAVDVQIWIVDCNKWVIGGRIDDRPVFHWDITLGDVLEYISTMPRGTRALFVLHPEYMRQ